MFKYQLIKYPFNCSVLNHKSLSTVREESEEQFNRINIRTFNRINIICFLGGSGQDVGDLLPDVQQVLLRFAHLVSQDHAEQLLLGRLPHLTPLATQSQITTPPLVTSCPLVPLNQPLVLHVLNQQILKLLF